MGPWGGNLGDAAIQQAMIYHIGKYYPHAKLFGFSLDPDDTQRRHGIPAFPIQRPTFSDLQNSQNHFISWLSALMKNHPNQNIRRLERWVIRGLMESKLLKNAYKNTKNIDLFIISGGGQLDDYWGGPFSHPYALYKFVTFARLNKAKVIFISVGAGPIDHRVSKFFIKRALAQASYRSYRDIPSSQLIDSIGFHRNDPIYPDLAFSLPVSQYKDSNSSIGGRLKVGIGPMCWFDPRIWPEKSTTVYLQYLEKLAQFTIWLLNRQYMVSFIPGEVGNDNAAIDDLLSILVKKGYPFPCEQIIQRSIKTVDELMSELVTVDVFVGTRLHTLLLAALVNKPMLAISYHQKIDSLMMDTGEAQYCIQIDTFDVQTAIERFEDLLRNRLQIQNRLKESVDHYQLKLAEQYEYIFNAI